MSVDLRRRLLKGRRTEIEFEEAKNNKTSQKLQMILNTCDLRRQEHIEKSHK